MYIYVYIYIYIYVYADSVRRQGGEQRGGDHQASARHGRKTRLPQQGHTTCIYNYRDICEDILKKCLHAISFLFTLLKFL